MHLDQALMVAVWARIIPSERSVTVTQFLRAISGLTPMTIPQTLVEYRETDGEWSVNMP
jgi:hypothetical protein